MTKSHTKFAFLDRDGTIINDVGYISDPDDVVILPGVVDALQLLQNLNYIIVIITNQSGIGRKIISEQEYDAVNKKMLRILRKNKIFIDKIYHCPHLPSSPEKVGHRAVCKCRKPGIELLQLATNGTLVDKNRSFMAGDKVSDAMTGKNFGIHGYLIDNNSTLNFKSFPSLLQVIKYHTFIHDRN